MIDFDIDNSSVIPIYQQIVDTIENAIMDDRLKSGDKLPTFRDLSDEIGVSLGTIKRAYDELMRLGIITMSQGRGSFISFPKTMTADSKRENAINIIDDAINDLQEIGFSPHEIRIFFDIRMREVEDDDIYIKIVIVGPNMDELMMIEDSLSEIPHLDIHRVLTDDLIDNNRNITLDTDLYITTFSYYSEVRNLLKIGDKLSRIALKTSSKTIRDLSKLNKDANVGLVSASNMFNKIMISGTHRHSDIENIFKDFAISENGGFGEFIDKHNALIVSNSFYKLANNEQIKSLRTFIDNGGEVVFYNFICENGSYVYVKEKIAEMYTKKTTGF